MKAPSRSARPRVAVLTPVFNEEANLPRYEEEVSRVLLDRTDADFRVVFIDDGSGDRSWPLICAMAERDPRFSGLRLSRNQGSHIALAAGFDRADGDAVATLACDLQDPPETLLDFLEMWRKGFDIVWGRRRSREDGNWRSWTSGLFEKLVRRLAMPKDSRFATGSFLLVDRRVAECYRRFKESNRITFALVAWTGFKQGVVEYDRRPRTAGVSGWTLGRMIRAMYDTFIGFSTTPIRLMTWLGVIVFVLSLMLAAYLVANWLGGHTLPGWTTLMLALTLFFGAQFLLMGVTGEYLYRIYVEVVRRPLYFISASTENHEDRKPSDDGG